MAPNLTTAHIHRPPSPPPRRIYLDRPEDPGMNIGSHAKAVSCMEWSHDLGSLVTGGWDGRVHIWCVRAYGDGDGGGGWAATHGPNQSILNA